MLWFFGIVNVLTLGGVGAACWMLWQLLGRQADLHKVTEHVAARQQFGQRGPVR